MAALDCQRSLGRFAAVSNTQTRLDGWPKEAPYLNCQVCEIGDHAPTDLRISARKMGAHLDVTSLLVR